MDKLLECCRKADQYPIQGSLDGASANEESLTALFEQLGKRKTALFSDDERETAMHFWETNGQMAGRWTQVTTWNRMTDPCLSSPGKPLETLPYSKL
jgi:hypothetical protein